MHTFAGGWPYIRRLVIVLLVVASLSMNAWQAFADKSDNVVNTDILGVKL